MRINLNLASRKYEDVRRFFIAWVASLAILALLTVALAVSAVVKRSNAQRDARDARLLEQNIAVLQKKRNELKAFENLPENREVAQQKQFWNTQISRRLFSWTLLLNELQRIMPQRAYVNSVQPELTPDNRLRLKLTVVGEKHADGLQLIERMESSKRFHSTRPLTENLRKERREDSPVYMFEIETYYTPATQESAKGASKEGV